MFAASNNGDTLRSLNDETELLQGEVFFDHDPGEDDLDAAFPERAAAKAQAAKRALLAYAAAKRYTVETGGISFAGHSIATDRETQAKLTAAFVMANANTAFAIAAWKLPSGEFVALSSSDVISMASAVLAHVGAAFSAEQAVAAKVDSGEIASEADIDAASWPANG